MRRRHLSFTVHLALGGVLAGALAMGGLSTSAVPDLPADAHQVAATQRLAVVQLNTDEDPAAFGRALAMAAKRTVRADAVTLQEVCSSWIAVLPAKTWSSSFRATRADGCGPGDPKGVAVLVKASFKKKTPSSYALPADHLRTPAVACLSFDKGRRRHDVCSTHLVAFAKFPDGTKQNAKKIRLAQAQKIKKRSAAWIAKGHVVVVAGDFNAPPNQAPLNQLYATPGGKGAFTEAAQLGGHGEVRGGDVTAIDQGRKIDYVFLSRKRVPASASGTLRLKKGSGHKMLVVRTRVR